MEDRRLHLMRNSQDEFCHENMDTHRIGKEETKNRTQNKEIYVECHVLGLRKKHIYKIEDRVFQ